MTEKKSSTNKSKLAIKSLTEDQKAALKGGQACSYTSVACHYSGGTWHPEVFAIATDAGPTKGGTAVAKVAKRNFSG